MFIEWRLNKHYKEGDKVVYNNIYYKCIQSHESFIEYGNPSQTNRILWTDDKILVELENDITLWSINKAYKKGNIVKFDYNLYYCIKNNLSNIMNSPPHRRDELWSFYKLENSKL
jgi:hypothetical protein